MGMQSAMPMNADNDFTSVVIVIATWGQGAWAWLMNHLLHFNIVHMGLMEACP